MTTTHTLVPWQPNNFCMVTYLFTSVCAFLLQFLSFPFGFFIFILVTVLVFVLQMFQHKTKVLCRFRPPRVAIPVVLGRCSDAQSHVSTLPHGPNGHRAALLPFANAFAVLPTHLLQQLAANVVLPPCGIALVLLGHQQIGHDEKEHSNDEQKKTRQRQ